MKQRDFWEGCKHALRIFEQLLMQLHRHKAREGAQPNYRQKVLAQIGPGLHEALPRRAGQAGHEGADVPSAVVAHGHFVDVVPAAKVRAVACEPGPCSERPLPKRRPPWWRLALAAGDVSELAEAVPTETVPIVTKAGITTILPSDALPPALHIF
eukprot:CAMPEP_0179156844 /NCGR_PEP_ID=MMETSP0796-20121207/76474_1 /TAXON_ID=73915 /ORGANISM="Pyrodinium bahamense, Strain pbaha01" /LENGTH=154 /DNA_ID=CAMNT_0020858437 /DNA_START=319 /DNA_END=783 /DNA_ORIENTATION=+